jgi:asparagine synthase (glutamine-hydrolysing)
MCGIAGILSDGQVTNQCVLRMTQPIAHRGPDDSGCWIDVEAGIGLGHRRLAIVDLSAAGHQPMHSADGRFVLTYNGEIYNYEDIRRELEDLGAAPEGGWRGHSDSEVLLQAIVTWGLRGALERSVGMWAIGLWDRRERTLSLVRDRFGEKPLYYGWVGRDFVFGSELKALTSHPQFDAAISRRALGLFAARTYIPPPFSVYERIFKLQPGCILTVQREAATRSRAAPLFEGTSDRGISLKRYWS